MSSKVFGTPVFVFSADDPANSGKGKCDKAETQSSRLQNAAKATKTLESAESFLQKALDALDGTGYDAIKQGISACMQHVKAEADKVVAQIMGNVQPAQPAGQQPAQAGVPTAGQLSGREPLPGDKSKPAQ